MASFFSGTPKIFHSDKFSGIITNVELWVVTTTLFLVMKFIIDSFGPWYSNNKFMFNTVIFLESFSRRMVPYTLGLMRPSPETKNYFFQVWAVLMVTLQCSVNVGSPYGRSKQTTLISMLSSLWTANLLRGRTVLFLDSLLWIIWLFNAARMVAHFLSSDMASRINQENMRLVSDYMKHEHHRHQLGDSAPSADPVTMRGYRYLVAGEQDKNKTTTMTCSTCTCTPTAGAGAGPPELSFQWHEKIITTESVWSLGDDGLLGTIADPGNRFKDVYLSYALYKLLRRRFCNLPMHEAAESKTRRLVFEGILRRSSSSGGNGGDDYERAFRITEVELSLLQDYFYGNHAVVFVNGFPVRRLGLSLLLVAALLFVAYPVQLIPNRSDEQPGLKIVTHGLLITYSIIALIVGKEIWEIYIHFFSQWTKVWMLCWYIRKAPAVEKEVAVREKLEKVVRAALEKVVRVMFRLVKRGKWNRRIGQYNIFISSAQLKLILFRLRPTTVELPGEVKRAIFESFKDLKSPQSLHSYFAATFQGCDQDEIAWFSWTNELETDTHRILVWHIATYFCEITGKPENSSEYYNYYVVADKISKYCAYLLTLEPKLVPNNSYVVCSKVFHAVRLDVFRATRRYRGGSGIRDCLMKIACKPDGDDDDDETILKQGAILGQQLLDIYGGGEPVGVWRVLAKFWTGFLLHLAASTKAASHKTHLEGRGELLTHLWALLFHAGLLGSTRRDDLFSEQDVEDAIEADGC